MQIWQALLLGLAFSLYRLRHRPTPRGCKESQLKSFRIRTYEKTPGGVDTSVSASGHWTNLSWAQTTQPPRTRTRSESPTRGLISLRTGCAAFDPDLHLGSRFHTGKRRQCAAVSRIPGPSDKIVVCDVIEKRGEGSPAVLLGVLELSAKFARGSSNKHHLLSRRRQRPLGTAGRHVFAGKILCLMAGVAAHSVDAVPVRAALHIL